MDLIIEFYNKFKPTYIGVSGFIFFNISQDNISNLIHKLFSGMSIKPLALLTEKLCSFSSSCVQVNICSCCTRCCSRQSSPPHIVSRVLLVLYLSSTHQRGPCRTYRTLWRGLRIPGFLEDQNITADRFELFSDPKYSLLRYGLWVLKLAVFPSLLEMPLKTRPGCQSQRLK